MRLRIGIANAKELEVGVAEPEAVLDAYRAARDSGEALLTVEEEDGAQVVLVVDAVVYFAGDPPAKGGVGFAAEAAS